MQFRSVDDLAAAILFGLHRVPTDVDLVVGVPRSGMLPATMIALYRNLPLADVDGWLEGRTLGVGSTRLAGHALADARTAGHILLVDDSVDSGRSLAAVQRKIADAGPPARVTSLVAYATPGMSSAVDIALEMVPPPRVFEWNVLHHNLLPSMGLDIDGVLCVDPSPEENDDGPRYRAFLRSAPVRQIPSKRAGWLVSNRLAKYRPETEAWLAEHGARYDALELLDLPDAATRRTRGNYGAFKASVYGASDALLFVESEPGQAEDIAKLSGKPVLCWETRTLVEPGMRAFRNPRHLHRGLKGRAKFEARRIYRRLSRLVPRW